MNIKKLKKVMWDMRINGRQLAIKSKVNQATISQVMNGKDIDLRGSTIKRLEDALGLKRGELL